MNFTERAVTLEGPREQIPALWAEPAAVAGRRRAGVLLLHGLKSDRLQQQKELRALAAEGFSVLCPDAPGHGARDPLPIRLLDALPEERWHEGFLEVVDEQVREVPRLVDWLGRQGCDTVSVAGISMGACVALSAAARGGSRLDAVVSVLGTPELSPKGEVARTPRLRDLLAKVPAVHRPERFADLPLLLANASLDESVPPEAARRFATTLRTRYGERPDRPLYLEYPESGHFMRAEDWDDLWNRVVHFLRRHAKGAPSR